MKIIDKEPEWFLQQAKNIHNEIITDLGVHNYWHPKINEERWPTDVPKHQTFEQAYMKFLNGNLNYYHFPNMVLHSQEQDGWNSAFPDTIEFCNKVRTVTGNRGPFGRMCVWDLPPGKRLLPHVDNFEYHRHIVRNIFVVSPNNNGFKIAIDGVEAPTSQGSFFQFQPHKQTHEFVNDSDEHFYFLGFDFWIMDRLTEALTKVDVEEVRNDSDRLKLVGDALVYGSINTRCKYQSNHGLELGKNLLIT
jgi:hypothetical protein